MPGWHALTDPYRRRKKLQVVGIIQEQHPDRARLFMQWKGMDWPVMVDSLNLLGVSAVPLTFLIDATGVIQKVQPDAGDLQRFLEHEPEELLALSTGTESKFDLPVEPGQGADSAAWRSYGDRLFLRGNPADLDLVIAAYGRALESNPEDGDANFRLGVAYRRRHESANRQAGDFARAVEFWGRALDLDPNQYIWRRRIQQYGPLLEKPYPFYDWIEVARKEILERGERPAELSAEPGDSERAAPIRHFLSSVRDGRGPDPGGRILRDREGLVRAEVVAVPTAARADGTIRYHVSLRPDRELDAHWNNEVEDLIVWVDLPEGWASSENPLTYPRPAALTSEEVRELEFEIRAPESFRGSENLPAYSLYYVCEGVEGTCLYRRLDLDLPFRTADLE